MILGVDPGKSGAAALFDSKTGKLVSVWDMPLTPAHEINAFDLSLRISLHAKEIQFAVVEDVHAMTYVNAAGEKRGQGAAASFAFGKAVGLVHGILASFTIPIFLVRPAVWKSVMGLSRNKADSLKLASELFPDSKGNWPLKKHDGRAEAALLAFFGARRFSL